MLTRDLAAFVAETPALAIPASARAAAKDAVVDTLGCAFAGYGHKAADIAARFAISSGSRADSTIWAYGSGTGAADAALVNALLAHALDFDDSLPSLRGHPSAPILAAGMAVGEMSGCSGAELLDAFVLAVEVAGTIGPALGEAHYLGGWHSTATVGAFSATAVAGRLLGLDAAAMANAFGLASCQSAGLLRNFGTMAKSFQSGQAARAGVTSALLSKAGMTADDSIFDGPGGYLETYGDKTPRDLDMAPGKPWKILDPGIYVKRWPCCYASHRPLAGIFELMHRHAIRPDEVEEVGVGFMPGAAKALIHTEPRDGLSAKFSIEYTAAAALLDGSVGLSSFDDEMVARPEAERLARRVRRFDMPGEGRHYSGVVGSTDVYIVTSRGRFDVHIPHTPGSPQMPMSPEERWQKFRDCTQYALEPVEAEEVYGVATNMSELATLDPLTSRLAVTKRR